MNGQSSEDGSSITKVDMSQAYTMADTAAEKVKAYISEKGLDNASLKDIIGGRKIVSQNLGLLPSTLPYKTVTVTSEFNKVAEENSDTIGFTIKGADPFNLNFSGDADFNVSFKSVDLYGKRITLSWVPASQEDTDVINAYGGIFNAPAYLIKVKPQLRVDGIIEAEGSAVGLGYRQQFTIVMGNAGSTRENITNPVTAGGYYCVGLDYGKISTSEIKAIQNRILSVKDTATDKNVYTDEVIGDILNAAAKSYFGQLDVFNDIIGEATNVSPVRLISECMTGYAPVVKYMFLTPVELTGGDFFIDVDHDVVGAVSREDKQEDTISYMLNSGILGSAMESGIFKQMLQMPSVSTIELLTVANKRGIPIYTINKSNADKINELTVSNSVKTDISNAVNNGKVVVIPKDEMNYYNWKGTGYIIMDSGTGAAGYMISGGLAGGSSAIDIAFTSIAGITDLLVCVYSGLDILLALSTPTSLIMIGVFFGLYILDYMAYQSMFNDLVMYWKTGDSQYATPLKVNFIISMAFFGFKILSATMPDGNTLFRHIVNYVKEWLGISTQYGDDVAKIVAEAGQVGTEVITKYSDDAARIISTYKDDGLIALYCYGDDLIEQVAKFGDDAVGCVINFGGEDALIAMQNGIEPSLISELNSFEINPIDFESYGIVSHETAGWAIEVEKDLIGISDTQAISEGITDSTAAEETVIGRPTWKQSEIDAFTSDYTEADGYTYKQSFIKDEFGNVVEAIYGEPGSIRIDIYKSDHIVEVKNYDITSPSGRWNLSDNIRKQYWQRKDFFPNTKQTYVIDIRGQNVSVDILKQLENSIYNNTETLIDIIFKS